MAGEVSALAAPGTRAALVDFAPAKVNLNLRVGQRRADGYHELESLVVFARIRDRVSLIAGAAMSLSLSGPTATASGAVRDNLVLRAARNLGGQIPDSRTGRFKLFKRLPVAAGLGGGSSDAAAALRLLRRANGLAPDDPRIMEAARQTGADVPVCLDPRPRIMRGIGEILSPPLHLPDIAAILVNPGVAVPTKAVFAALAAARAAAAHEDCTSDPATILTEHATSADQAPSLDALIEALARSKNDLEPAAIAVQPVIADVLSRLRRLPGCRLARMSGSGATCFGLFDRTAAAAGARALKANHSGWWVRASVLGIMP